ncbi:hypothetical protein A4X09_0g7422 [Tilletia walkeri]|uniref:Winged helix-turn helix domain-containing protein n=1 Tax=Tilletia walkeri TaxID=117179 RepID=A0A8X7T1G3_9BASI|nr:hypothetical protein A4X09_0g7422 [Tilletia walkeri]
MDDKLTAAEAESDLISRRTIGRSIAKIREHGHIPQKKKSTGRPTKLTDVAKSFMLAYIRRHPSTFQEELQELLKAFYNIEIHQSNMSRFLAREGYTFKKMSRRAAQRDEARRLSVHDRCRQL